MRRRRRSGIFVHDRRQASVWRMPALLAALLLRRERTREVRQSGERMARIRCDSGVKAKFYYELPLVNRMNFPSA